MEITAQQVKELREATGAGVLDCRKALETHEGDLEKAAAYLREKGLAAAAKKAGREAKRRHGRAVLARRRPGGRHGGGELRDRLRGAHRAVSGPLPTTWPCTSPPSAPRYVDVADIPAGLVDEMKSTARSQAVAEGKPERVHGKHRRRPAGEVLSGDLPDAPAVRQERRLDIVGDLIKQTIAAIGENIIVRRFARWELGEAA